MMTCTNGKSKNVNINNMLLGKKGLSCDHYNYISKRNKEQSSLKQSFKRRSNDHTLNAKTAR